jgi:thioredoxin reductase/SAM-dependent methyltransferase
MAESFDVVVVGGGAAGLSGALALARSRRSVLVLDDGEPRNAPAGHVHNFLTRDGTPPAELYAAGRDEVTRYGGQVRTGRVAAVTRDGDRFTVSTADGDAVTARRLLVATGVVDELPGVAGLRERWGRDVLHCPYCHGWEVRDQAIAVLATSPMGVHQALLFRQLSEHVVYLRHDGPGPSAEEGAQLEARGITVVEGRVVSVHVVGDRLAGVRLADGRTVPCDALVVSPVSHARADFLAPLGLVPEPVRAGEHVVGTAVPADPTGATAVPGVWVAGNVADVRAQVITSAAAGLWAGAAINAGLVAADATRAVQRHGHGTLGHDDEEVWDRAWWDERYRSAPALWSGRPNPVLVAEAEGLPPGTALDAGAGEGGDALWLAERGWQVEAVDISTVALERGAAEADRRGLTDRIGWRRADLAEWQPDASYDLVTTSYLHLPGDLRGPLYARLAAAVAPGGRLLIAQHDPSDAAVVPRPDRPDLYATADGLAAELDPAEWDVLVAEARPRTAVHPGNGREVTVHDAVLLARRR